MKQTIYLTTFDPKTKHPTAASVDLNVKTIKEAEQLMPGEPIVRTHNTSIYEGGICLSWIRFSMSIDILES
tara:strand:- start:1148 stop:1360 length:213 start_codon:yes stop_codon:yes gene_type:complete